MTYKELTERYLGVDEDLFETEQLTTEIRDILLRGYVCCNNDGIQNAKVMLTGINPSFPEGAACCPHKVVEKFELSTATGGYWTRKRNQFGDLVNSMAYYDLFPIRETHQNKVFEKAFKNANDIRRRFLEHTQMAIEDLKPKLIIHANRDSMYYWGIRNYGRGNNTVHPWMGYSVERMTRSNCPELPECCTEERLAKFPLYRINGFVSSNERINNERLHKTNLSYIMEYVMDYRTEKDIRYLYTPEEWKEIVMFDG